MNTASKKELPKTVQKQVLAMFTGKKNQQPIKNGRKIAEILRVPRHSVMRFLDSKGLTEYSAGSYH